MQKVKLKKKLKSISNANDEMDVVDTLLDNGAAIERIDRLFSLQSVALKQVPYLNVRARLDILKKLEATIIRNRINLCDAISMDYGNRAKEETLLAEINNLLSNLRYTKKRIRRWMRPKRKGASIWNLPGSNKTVPVPVGIVGIIAPWNYPINLALVPAVAAIAAGNRVMIKMPEQTPQLTSFLKLMMRESFPEDQIAIIDGGVQVAEHFSAQPFGHLLFTGSTAVGKKVMHAAAENLTPVTLELGGKSPAIVGPGYSIEEAARRIVWGRLFNAGQTCVAADYAIVPKGQEKTFANAAIAAARKMYPAINNNSNYSSIINVGQLNRLRAIVDDAVKGGATLLASHPLDDIDIGRKFPLCVLLNAPPNSRALTEEIFGPILPIVNYNKISDAIAYVNERDTPLAAYYFGGGAGRELASRELNSGGVTLNDTLLHYLQDDLPFGGMGSSGFGNYHGRNGFDAFSHEKSIFTQRGIGHFTGTKLVYPPYSKMTHMLLTMMRKF